MPTPKVSFYKTAGWNSKKKQMYYAALEKSKTGVVSILVGTFMLIKRSVFLIKFKVLMKIILCMVRY